MIFALIAGWVNGATKLASVFIIKNPFKNMHVFRVLQNDQYLGNKKLIRKMTKVCVFLLYSDSCLVGREVV
jgi:hypothetical protein